MSIHNIDSTSSQVIEAVIVPTGPSEALVAENANGGSPAETAAPQTTDAKDPSLVKVLGKEFLNFVLLCLVSNAWVPRFVSPIASLITGERDVSPLWRFAVVLAVLVFYGFSVGKSDKVNRTKRILFQTFMTVCSSLLGIVLASGVTGTRLLYVALVGIALNAGALTGWAVSDEKPLDEATTKKPEKKSNPVQTVLLSIVGFAIGIGLLVGSQFLGTAAQRSIYVDKVAPETVFETADGQPWTFADHRGKVVLVKFWAPYCAPCVASFPSQHRTYEEFSQHDDFEMVSISYGDRERSIQMFRDQQAPWNQVFPPEQSGPNDLRPYGIPAAYIIDRDGKIVAAQVRGRGVEAKLNELFQQDSQ